MKALILAAGRGTRLGKLTENLPKPLVQVNGKPVIDYLINKLIKLDVNEIFINIHYKYELLEKFILDSKYKTKITLVHEDELLGTAGTLKNLIYELSVGDFIVMHADNYFLDDLETLKQSHLLSNPEYLITLGTFPVTNPENFGTVELSKNNTVLKYFEKQVSSSSKIANSAIYFMKPGIETEVRKLKTYENDIGLNLLPRLLGKIKAIELKGYFYDIGTPENLLLANKEK